MFKKTGEVIIANNVVKDLKVALLEHNQIKRIYKNFAPIEKFLEQYQ